MNSVTAGIVGTLAGVVIKSVLNVLKSVVVAVPVLFHFTGKMVNDHG